MQSERSLDNKNEKGKKYKPIFIKLNLTDIKSSLSKLI